MKLHELFEAEAPEFEEGYLTPQPKQMPKFSCQSMRLLSLKGSPEEVEANFVASHNRLTSLEGGPTYVGGSYYCNHNELTTLKGAPKEVGNNPANRSWSEFDAGHNRLTSYEGGPAIVDGNVSLRNNKFTNLHNIHKHLKQVGEECQLHLSGNPIKSHMLGLLLIKGLVNITFDENKQVAKIINQHLLGDRDVVACQQELLEHDFDEYAQL